MKNDEKIVIGLSGGPDSTALTVALGRLAPALGAQLVVAHFNHSLRGRESDEDEGFAARLAEKMKLTFVSRKMDVQPVPKGVSPEDFYRQQRYRFFDETARSNHAGKVALGHNMQDQAETVLLHLLRGSGLEGLKGIMPLRDGKYIRPLLEVSREEIIKFLTESGIAYRRDSSNESSVHARNKIRLELLPYLKKEFNPKIDETLAQMAEILREENELIRACTAKALKSTCIKRQRNRILLNVEYMNLLPVALQRRVLKELLETFAIQKNGITFLHVNSVGQLMQGPESGRKICLPFGIEARREYESLILERTKGYAKQTEFEYVIDIPGAVYVKERNLTVSLRLTRRDEIDLSAGNKNYFDLDKIMPPLVLRNRRNGDWFHPLGMTGRQKLKDFFIDHKIPQQKRNEIILLVDRQSVLWIEHMRLSDQVKITPKTKKFLELEII
ncbi:MAG TPA: tRNA lysidine(34) synthetase TilS [Smithellaceae bacterium]|nr:tRNA lysidine(34) synthetase TilS [Smithellaceae bacterium]